MFNRPHTRVSIGAMNAMNAMNAIDAIKAVAARIRRLAGALRRQPRTPEHHRPPEPAIGPFGLLSGSGSPRR